MSTASPADLDAQWHVVANSAPAWVRADILARASVWGVRELRLFNHLASEGSLNDTPVCWVIAHADPQLTEAALAAIDAPHGIAYPWRDDQQVFLAAATQRPLERVPQLVENGVPLTLAALATYACRSGNAELRAWVHAALDTEVMGPFALMRQSVHDRWAIAALLAASKEGDPLRVAVLRLADADATLAVQLAATDDEVVVWAERFVTFDDSSVSMETRMNTLLHFYSTSPRLLHIILRHVPGVAALAWQGQLGELATAHLMGVLAGELADESTWVWKVAIELLEDPTITVDEACAVARFTSAGT